MLKIVIKILKLPVVLIFLSFMFNAKADSLRLDKPLLFTWQTDIHAQFLITKGEKILAVQQNGYFSALSSFDGKILWRVNLGGNNTLQPIITGSAIYNPTNSITTVSSFTTIRSLNLETGITIWKTDLPNSLDSYFSDDSLPYIYCLLTNNEVITLNKSNGEIINTIWLPKEKSKKIYFLNNKLLLFTYHDGLRVFSLESKKFVWQSSFQTPISKEPLVIGNFIVIHTVDNLIYSVNFLTGKIEWRKKITTKQQSLYTAINGILVTNTDNIIYFLTLEGKLKWKKILDGKFTGLYLIQNNSILIFPLSGDTGIVIDILKGNILNRIKIDETNFLQTPPVVTNSHLLLQTQRGLNAYSN